MTADYDDVHGQQGGDNVDCEMTFGASWYYSHPHLFKKGDLNDLDRDLNLSLKNS